MLQQAIGEAAGGSANIETAQSIYINCELTQRCFEFQTAAADIARRRIVSAFDTNLSVGRNRSEGLFTRCSSTSTTPAMISACAFVRVSARPRSTSNFIDSLVVAQNGRASSASTLQQNVNERVVVGLC